MTRSPSAGALAVRSASTTAANPPTSSRWSSRAPSGLVFEARTRTLSCPGRSVAAERGDLRAAQARAEGQRDDRAVLEAARRGRGAPPRWRPRPRGRSRSWPSRRARSGRRRRGRPRPGGRRPRGRGTKPRTGPTGRRRRGGCSGRGRRPPPRRCAPARRTRTRTASAAATGRGPQHARSGDPNEILTLGVCAAGDLRHETGCQPKT